MKLKLIAAAVAFAAAGSVHAVDIVISGATASGNTQRAKIISDLCGGTAINYRVPTANDFWAVNCTLTAPASLAGQNYTFYKAGLGSGFGVTNVDEDIPVRVVDIGTCALNDDAATPTVTEYDCAAPTTNFTLVPQIGFSDVEPNAFVGDLAPAGQAYDGAGLTAAPIFGLVFGVIISENLRDTLQNAQGLPAGSELEADMPSLSAQAIRSLKAGRINRWTSVGIDMNGIEGITGYRNDIAGVGVGLAGGTVNNLTTFNVGAALTDTRVHICRRAAGSGTLAQYAMNFHGTNCASGAALTRGVAGANGYLPAAVSVRMVSQPQGSGDMEKCVSNLTAGASVSYSVPGGQVFGAPSRVGYAIGHQSLERNATLTQAYRFVKVDGEAPTCANVHAGKYFDFAESTLNRKDGAPSNVVAVFDALVAAFSADTEFACSFPHSFGFSGLMGVPGGANVPAATWTDSTTAADNSVNAFTKLGNTCQAPVIAPNAPSMLVN